MQFGSVNPELLGLARSNISRFAEPMTKRAFVPGSDPTMMGGDPSQGGGGAPPPGAGGPPGMPPGGDPSQGGGAPPPGAGGSDPTAGISAGAPDISNMIQQQVMAAMQAQGGAAGGGAGGAGAGVKPKIDQNVTMLQILKILAKIADTLKIPIPASEMVVTPDDLKAMSQPGGSPGSAAAQDQQSAIKPPDPIQPAMPMGAMGKAGADSRNRGEAFDTRNFESTMHKAAAIAAIRKSRGNK